MQDDEFVSKCLDPNALWMHDCWSFYTHIKVPPNSIRDCWIWQGPRHSGGYGRLWLRNRRWMAHRLSYELHYGAIPEGKVIRHRCHQPMCVNPHHLQIGTQQQNVDDMHRAGRQGYVQKLQPKHISEILSSPLSQTELAHKYSVSKTTIHRILKIKPKHKYK
tara:strand:+ start:5782 stop:6267 length:486 start_codon:yes stop_codon:yes gene_type:complete